ncbi:hypothetical protein [Amycolatopsis magusensis]|uniref:hypothetical protein n=1 Tax=Amycolatopsis magusensis TaxID=882444 RepID=UPI003C2FC406
MDVAASYDRLSDGPARYRANGLGGRVVVLPATCRRGTHQLPAAGFRALASDGAIVVDCFACGAGEPVNQWRLSMSGAIAERAEFDDQPYANRPARPVKQ